MGKYMSKVVIKSFIIVLPELILAELVKEETWLKGKASVPHHLHEISRENRNE